MCFRFGSVVELEERLIDLIESSITEREFQRKQNKDVGLNNIIEMGRTFEATASRVNQLQIVADSARVNAIKSYTRFQYRNCDRKADCL